MATYTTLRKGSSGDEVKKLQESLNAAGNYNLATDGMFGDKTLAAVKDYQTKNNLAVDGIVGQNTWGALTKTSSTTTAPTTAPTTQNATQTATTPKFEYANLDDTDIVAQAKAKLEQLGGKPIESQSQWQNSLQETINKIMNGEKFSYDLNGDALYQQYKDQYTTQGQMAMMDTMGQAQAMTGGYGNSYAQGVGQQAYQGYLQQLNDRVPELYQLALDQHNQEKQNMLNQYALLSEQVDREHNIYREAVSDYNAERDYLTNMLDTAYNVASNERNFNYDVYSDDVANQWKQKEFEYTKERNAIEDAYRRERDAVADAQFEKQYNLSASKASSGGTGNTDASLLHVATMSSKELVETLGAYKTDGDNEALESFLDDCVAVGRLTEAQADDYYKKYKTGEDSVIDTTVNLFGSPKSPSGGGASDRKYVKHMLN